MWTKPSAGSSMPVTNRPKSSTPVMTPSSSMPILSAR